MSNQPPSEGQPRDRLQSQYQQPPNGPAQPNPHGPGPETAPKKGAARWAVPLVVGVVLVGGFIVKVATEDSDRARDVEREVASELGVQADQVSCPGTLPNQVGATMTCTGPVDGVNRTMLIRVVEVSGGTATFDVTVQ